MKNSEEPIATQSPENTTEQAPAALDRGVQATSRNTAHSGTPPSWRQTWYRPAIFIGLVGITLSVMLEVTGPDLPDVQTSAVVGEAEAPPRDAVSRTQAPRRQALATESSTAAGETTAGIVGNNIGRENCSDEERSSASAWWQCIEELRRAGRDDAAESELRQLLEDFPKFAIPEDANTSPDE